MGEDAKKCLARVLAALAVVPCLLGAARGDTISLSDESPGVLMPDAKHEVAAPCEAPAFRGESPISADLYGFMVDLPGFELGDVKVGEPALIVFTWQGCQSCQAFLSALRERTLPLRILEIPAGGTPMAEQSGVKRLAALGHDAEWSKRRLRDAARIIRTLAGRMEVPAFAWAMDDGLRFGILSVQEALWRIDGMVKKLGAGKTPRPSGEEEYAIHKAAN